VFVTSSKKQGYRDSEFYMSHYQKDASTEKGSVFYTPSHLILMFVTRYSLTDGASSFAEQARGATFDLAGDEGIADRRKRQLNWDKKKKRFIKGDGVGADNVKLVKTENGTRLPATYRSGRFDEWKAKSRVSLPKIGEAENEGTHGRRRVGPGGKRFKHNRIVIPKPLDKRSMDYERKARQMKKRNEGDGGESSPRPPPSVGGKRGKVGGRYGGKSVGRVKTELKTTEQIRKGRKVMENKRAKNARPSRGGKKGKR
jgi:ATP-dependent RNA helicase DDX54/DBP10